MYKSEFIVKVAEILTVLLICKIRTMDSCENGKLFSRIAQFRFDLIHQVLGLINLIPGIFINSDLDFHLSVNDNIFFGSSSLKQTKLGQNKNDRITVLSFLLNA